MFYFYLRTNSDLCHLQHKLIGFYNRNEKCLLCGTNRVFKYSSLRFLFKRLITKRCVRQLITLVNRFRQRGWRHVLDMSLQGCPNFVIKKTSRHILLKSGHFFLNVRQSVNTGIFSQLFKLCPLTCNTSGESLW